MQDTKKLALQQIGLLFLSGVNLNEDYNKGLENFKNRLLDFKKHNVDLYITIHRPDHLVGETCSCVMRLWITKPFIGPAGHASSTTSRANIKMVSELLSLEDAKKFASLHGTFIGQEGVGGTFSKNGTSLYKVK